MAADYSEYDIAALIKIIVKNKCIVPRHGLCLARKVMGMNVIPVLKFGGSKVLCDRRLLIRIVTR